MDIKKALNRIVLSLLLDKRLVWNRFNNFDILSKNINLLNNRVDLVFECALLRCVLPDGSDKYTLDINVKEKFGKVAISYESSFNVVHSDKLITEVLSTDELRSFISINEDVDGKIYELMNGKYVLEIIAYASKLFAIDDSKKIGEM